MCSGQRNGVTAKISTFQGTQNGVVDDELEIMIVSADVGVGVFSHLYFAFMRGHLQARSGRIGTRRELWTFKSKSN